MSFDLTPDQIKELAPDAASLQAARRLALPHSWQSLGRNDAAVWGTISGSGSTPYRVQVALAALSSPSHCTCPSRKRPCKHALGLLLIMANEQTAIPVATPPAWIIRPATEPLVAPDDAPQRPVAKQHSTQRATIREARVASGIGEVRLWLDDLLRQGLAAAQQQPLSYWENAAARLVDAQAPGLARLVRQVPGIIGSGGGWQERALEHVARFHMLLEGYSRIDVLSEAQQADIRAAVGWNIRQEDVRAGERVRDRWHIVGRRVIEEDNLQTQRTWLMGQRTQRPALLLDFAPAHQPLNRSLAPGTALEADLVFYPSAAPLRALVHTQHDAPTRLDRFHGTTIDQAIAAYTSTMTHNPWLEHFPVALDRVIPLRAGAAWRVRDTSGNALPLARHFTHGFELLALSGYQPIGVFGEWNGTAFTPLGVWAEERWHAL